MLVSELRKIQAKEKSHYENIISSIDLQSFQDAVLFSGITKQNDMHEGNAFLSLTSSGKTYAFRLFDIGRCMTPDGVSTIKRKYANSYSEKPNEMGTIFYFRCFFLSLPQIDGPLTVDSIRKIKEWNKKALEELFVCDPAFRQKVESLQSGIGVYAKILHEENASDTQLIASIQKLLLKKEQELHVLLTTHIGRDELIPFLERIGRVQQLLLEKEEQGKIPTLLECLKAANPIEMEFMQLYEEVFGKEHIAARMPTVEDAIDYGLSHGKFTSQRAEHWRKRLKQFIETGVIKIIPWQYSKTSVLSPTT